MHTLREERACDRFIAHVIGLTNWVDDYAARLGDETHEFTTDSLMRLHFDKTKSEIQAFLADTALVDAFQELHPTRAGLLAAGSAMCQSFDRLHTVRMSLILPHKDGDKMDVHNHKDAFLRDSHITSDQDSARLHDLSDSQYAIWKAHCNEHGFVHLSRTERATLRQAILDEFIN